MSNSTSNPSRDAHAANNAAHIEKNKQYLVELRAKQAAEKAAAAKAAAEQAVQA